VFPAEILRHGCPIGGAERSAIENHFSDRTLQKAARERRLARVAVDARSDGELLERHGDCVPWACLLGQGVQEQRHGAGTRGRAEDVE
jgi:hypothetical protein